MLTLSPISKAIATTLLFSNYALAEQAASEIPHNNTQPIEVIDVVGSYTTKSMDYSTGLDLSIRETPQSISVITRQQIDDKGITEIAQALRQTTGISMNQAETDRVFPSARGFSIDNIQFDGSPVRGANGGVEGDFLSDMAIYQRVEIIRGAAGLLMGAGNPSAAINLIRKKPMTEQHAKVTVKTGSWGLTRTDADASTPLGFDDKLSGRVVAAYEDSDSYISSLERGKTVLYGIVQADFTAYTRLNIGIDYQKHHVNGVSFGETVPMYYSDGTRTDLPRSSNTGTDWTYRNRDRTVTFASLKHQFANSWELNIYGSYMDGQYDDERVYVVGYLEPETHLGLTPYPSATAGEWQQDSFDIRTSGPFELFGRDHQVVVGYNSSFEKNSRSRRATLNTTPDWSFDDWQHLPYPEFADQADQFWGWETKQSGAYISGQFSLIDPLSIIVGLRTSTWEHSIWGNTIVDVNASGSGILTPYLGLVYDINSQFSGYASLTEIYNFQTQIDRTGNLLEPLEGANYEAGVKAELFDSSLNFSSAIFLVAQSNLATPDIKVIVDGVPEQRYKAEQGVTTKGFEIELSGELIPNLEVYAGYTYRKARNADDEDVVRIAPENMLRLSSSYDLEQTISGLTVGGGLRWQSEIFTNRPTGPNGETPEQKAYAVADLFMRYKITADVSASINIDNLFDKRYFESVGVYSFGAYGQPRSYSAQITYQF
ncbi:TonB-dependent siderophore receptor [Pseudoalteromonas porphyrae]|uniref:Ferric siderophore receptor n=1 Tax=Pseudoalteromonas porphyrae TaxID=187330 RepID=A0A0N0M1T4_9GAMM|nr:TonB-dependent siderophore receptor [Pseudoalteromonas porphyrae]KPH65601.1 ferric siderophore receptor [Pseudoalteromonas porphyrae]